MATRPPGGQSLGASGDSTIDPEIAPPVVAVMVTRNPGQWLEPALRSLAGQDYPDLQVLVVDSGSQVNPTERVLAALPDAVVRHTPQSVGFAVAANQALQAAPDATFLLLCHDDVELDPDAVRLMLEEAYRSNAGIVGPKLVDAEDPEILLEVGRSIDRFGNPHTGIEPGELDQEQHDAVRDVFYVSSAAMLVRVDLFRALGGFEPGAFPGSEDLDLCWRARLAGARVLVAPDARVRHHEAAEDRGSGDAPDPVERSRSRIRTVLTLSSPMSLMWIVPIGFVAALVEAFVRLVTFRRRGARGNALGAWWWNFRHLGELRQRRRKARRAKRIDDAELHELQVRGGWLTGFVTHHVATEDRVRSITDASRSAVETATTGARQPLAIAAVVLGVIYLFGSRLLIGDTVPAVGSFARWPGIGDLLATYSSGWRYTGLGSGAAAPPLFVIMSGISGALLGAEGLARTLVVVAAVPIGAWGALRLARAATGPAPAVVAAFAYAINPVARNAIAEGQLGPLVLFALAPFLVARLVRFAARPVDEESPATPGLLGLVVLTAVATAFYPLAPVVTLIAAGAVLVAAPFVGGWALGARMLFGAVLAGALALVLLFPWSAGYFDTGSDTAALGLAYRPVLSLSEVLRFETGPSGAGWAGWGLIVAAALPLVFGRGTRLAWATRAWVMVLVGWGAVWIPSRFAADTSVPAPEAALTLSALGLALAVGLGVATFVDDVRRVRFGWAQLAAVVAAVGILLPTFSFVADATDGRWRAPPEGWPDALAFLEAEQSTGAFRVLWVADPSVLPLDPVVLDDGNGYVLTRNGPGDARGLWRAPVRSADELVGDALDLASSDRTQLFGHLVAPMGVRYIAMPLRNGPGGGPRVEPARGVRDALTQQLDLARLEAPAGLVLYENTAWIPAAAVVPEDDADAVPLDSKHPNAAALGSDLAPLFPVPDPTEGGSAVDPGTVLWSEAYDADWKATADGKGLDHVRPFGWENGYVLPDRASVSIRYEGQLRRFGEIAIQVGLWSVVGVVWWRGRRRARRSSEAEVA